uniref:Prefoldin subunit 1 n=1 Tax=Globodera rostochiensis TaxID=31243 RepID=A0A914IAZ6_GLORO
MATTDFDAQLRKAFQELQGQILESRDKQKNAEITKMAMKQNIRIAEIVKSQLEKVPKDRTVYRTVGRIFLKETVDSEIERQNADIETCTERIAVMDRQKGYLDKTIAETEKNLRELIQTRRRQ